MTGRPHILAETSWQAVREQRYDLAILPWGATEAHNHHLPYGTDVFEAELIAAESARLAWESGTRAIVLPTVPFGVNTSQLDIPLTVNLNPTTQLAVLEDVAASLAGQGIPKLLVLNSHGGNDFRWMIRELLPRQPLFICCVDFWKVLDLGSFFSEPGDHAGEMETALLMHLLPDLVLPLDQAGDGAARRPTVPGLREGWAWTPRRWTQVTADTGVGDPRRAQAADGERFFTALCATLADFLRDLAQADPDALYA